MIFPGIKGLFDTDPYFRLVNSLHKIYLVIGDSSLPPAICRENWEAALPSTILNLKIQQSVVEVLYVILTPLWAAVMPISQSLTLQVLQLSPFLFSLTVPLNSRPPSLVREHSELLVPPTMPSSRVYHSNFYPLKANLSVTA